MLPQSVLDHVEKDFSQEDRDEVLEILSSYGTEDYEREQERVLLGVLNLSKGSREAVRDYVERAKKDYRDILFWAEYPAESRLETPEKIAEFRKVAKRLGVDLTIESEKTGK